MCNTINDFIIFSKKTISVKNGFFVHVQKIKSYLFEGFEKIVFSGV